MAADPVVSPADTIRRQLEKLSLDETGYHPDSAKEQRLEALAALAALLAVGERDKALLVQAGEEIAALTDAVLKCQRSGERDRQHIARLTELIRELIATVPFLLARRTRAMARRLLIVAPPWIVVAPAFYSGWIPWWYGLLLIAAFSVSQTAAEAYGRAAGEGDTRP